MMGFARRARQLSAGLAGGRNLVSSGSDDPSYWRARAVDVFAHDWLAVVAAFPAVVHPHEVARVTPSHSARTDLFNTTTLIALRAGGQFRWSSLRVQGVRRSMHLPWWKLAAVLALPMPVLRGGGAALGAAKRLLRRQRS